MNTDVHIVIPPEYVGQKLELLLFSTNETKKAKSVKPATLEKYIGMLTPEDADKLQLEIKKSRKEWDRGI